MSRHNYILAFAATFALLSCPFVVSPASAGNEYPRNCRNAMAVFDSARAYSKEASVLTWKADRFDTARRGICPMRP